MPCRGSEAVGRLLPLVRSKELIPPTEPTDALKIVVEWKRQLLKLRILTLDPPFPRSVRLDHVLGRSRVDSAAGRQLPDRLQLAIDQRREFKRVQSFP